MSVVTFSLAPGGKGEFPSPLAFRRAGAPVHSSWAVKA